ncbi:acyl-CoA dehydrogenase family protein [Novosphingobium sp. Leaf2]|uniref:acyl-CoA dehydrogenase family protein n=1 Tax=Novosphingobium sp. Leaf2 TaxID=1735670 RepID=UPI000701FC78|nr:acyl-CoA dehydrogenase family protein [Novosphingobium sp. Leaf2]KQM20805.1 oxidoreductase [Novosphingobium sp. Leaf2]
MIGVSRTPIHESIHSTAEGRAIRDRVRAIVPMLREQGAEAERIGCMPLPSLNALADAGVFRISVPVEHNGYALGARDLAEIVTEIARGDGSAAWITMIGSGFARVMLTFPDRAVEEVYGLVPEWKGPVVASASLFSEKIQRARKVDGGYVVEAGCKWGFGSGCKHAAFMVVGVQADDVRGMVLLERGQYEIVDDWKVMGLSGSSSNSITVAEEVFIPEHRFADLSQLPANLDNLRNRFGGMGYKLDGLGLMLIVAMETMAITLGMARGAFDCFVAQCENKKPFNLPYETLAATPSIEVVAGKTRAMINAAEALIFARADHIDRKAQAGEAFTPSEESEIMMDFVHAGNVCGAAIDMIQIALGSFSVSLANPIQRYVRDTRVALTHGSTRLDPAAEISGRQLMGLPPLSAFAAAVPGVDKAQQISSKAA